MLQCIIVFVFAIVLFSDWTEVAMRKIKCEAHCWRPES